MKLILKNIRNMVHYETPFFIIMCLCVYITSIVLSFAFCLYGNYTREKQEADDALHSVSIEINPDVTLCKKDFLKYVESIPDSLQSQITLWYTAGKIPEYDEMKNQHIDFRFVYRNGKYYLPEPFKKVFDKQKDSGRIFTEEEEKNGEYVAVVTNDPENGWLEKSEVLRAGENEIRLFEHTYKVIGAFKYGLGHPIIPFSTVPDSFIFDSFLIITFENVLNRNQYNILVSNADQYIPNALIFPALALPDNESIALYNNFIWISAFISILSILNFAMLYHFVLKTRSREIAIMRICGCTKISAYFRFIAECLLISVPCFIVGCITFRLFMKHILNGLFPYMESLYSIKVILAISGTYFLFAIMLLSCLIIHFLHHTILQEWRAKRQ